MYDEERPYQVVNDAPTEKEREGYWEVASSLQICDGLEVSAYAESVGNRYISGDIDSQEAERQVTSRYAAAKEGDRQAEADIVATRIVSLLESSSFILSPGTLTAIHATLFDGVLPAEWVGCFRNENITKAEPVLGGRSVQYADYHMLRETLAYDFQDEKAFVYPCEFDDLAVDHFSDFISRVWQSHPFREGNTRTTAVFSELYLRSMGFEVSNDRFAENAQYFRDALVRASYSSIRDGIKEEHSFINSFFKAVIFDEAFETTAADMNIHGIRVDDTPYREARAMSPHPDLNASAAPGSRRHYI